MMRRRSYIGALLISVGLAVLAFCVGPGSYALHLFGGSSANIVPASRIISICIWIAWLWIFEFAVALALYRWRTLWLLLVAPLALWWPVMWIFVSRACDIIGRCR
jgi:hypothetical protein